MSALTVKMSDTQLLRQMVNERLAAAAEDIFGLIEKTIADYQEQVFSSRSEIVRLKEEIEQLSLLKPVVKLLRTDVEECVMQQPDQIPALKESDTLNPEQIKEEQEELCISQDMEAESYEETQPEQISQNDCQPFPVSSEITSTHKDEDDWNESDNSSSSVCSPSHSKITFTKNKSAEKDKRKRTLQTDPKKTCRVCCEHFRTDADLLRHMDESHMGEKAFKCTQCDKVFEQKHGLVLHVRVHTGEKPYSCDFCGKTFTQNSNRVVHMRQHTGEKPYFCINCDKSFANSHHLRLCAARQNKGEKNPFRCLTCGRTFSTDLDLSLHTEVHNSWKRHLIENQHKPV